MPDRIDRGVDFKEWRLFERIDLLNELVPLAEATFTTNGLIQINDYPYSSGQKVAIDFLLNPTSPVKFTVLDNNFGKKILSMHIKFWKSRFGNEGNEDV